MSIPERTPDNDATVVGGVATPPPGSSGVFAFQPMKAFEPGTMLADRYEVVQLLGEGGMGAVYKARDRELDRVVALKTIRTELAGSAEMLARFKQELILARQITHRNVIRIYDLGEAAGMKFITMEFVEGDDLRTILRDKGKFTPEEAVTTVQQVCRALEAAHTEGVIHRDLKPQNIMRDASGRIVVMDFGLARSLDMGGMTQTGALVGTMEYMSPEQAMGENLDARSDLFTVGLIFYELVTGKVPYKADTALASLFKRAQERAIPPSEIDASVPAALSAIVSKCLERDRSARYQSAAELLHDLEQWQAPGIARSIAKSVVLPKPIAASRRWYYAAGATVLVLVLVVGGIGFRHQLFSTSSEKSMAPAAPAMSVAVLPLRNASGDPKMDWMGSSVAEMLDTDIGQSAQVRTVPGDRMHQILSDLKITPDAQMDPAGLQRLAQYSSADVIVWGQYAQMGNRVRLDLTIQDFKHNRTVPIKAEAANENELLATVDSLAQSIRSNLALSSSAMDQLRATAFKPSTKSIAALRDYNTGLASLRNGQNLEAQKAFQSATQDDPQFALAWSQLAQTYANLGYGDQAEQASRRSVDLSNSLPTPEKYRIVAQHARIMKDYPKAIAAYEQLAKSMPDDTDVQFTLGRLYEDTGAFDKARTHYSWVLERDPKSVDTLLALGRVALMQGNYQASLDQLNRALSLTVELNNDEQKAKILQAIGVDYRFLNKPDDALRYYQESLDIKKRLGDKLGIADSLQAIAQAQADQGKMDLALKGYQDALKLRREIGDNKGIGDTLIDLGTLQNDRGQYDDALKAYKEALQIQRDVGNRDYEALALNNIGSSYLFKGQYEDARTYYQQALDIREKLNVPGDTAETLHNLAETAADIGNYDQATGYYLRALELHRSAGDKRTAAIDSYSMADIFVHQGRYGAAVSSMGDALKTLRELNDQSYWLGEVLSGYGNALNQAGRADEGRKTLDQAMQIAHGLKNDMLIAQTLNYQGDRAFLTGDFKSAKAFFAQSLPVAVRAKDTHLLLETKFNLAKVALRENDKSAIATMRAISAQADTSGQEYLGVEASLYGADAMVGTRQYDAARPELDRVLNRSEKYGLRMLQAKAHYLLGKVAQGAGNSADAQQQFSAAHQILNDIRKETGTDAVLKRSDLAAIVNAK
jgi:tetratricopeptide (TPR) repeat protein